MEEPQGPSEIAPIRSDAPPAVGAAGTAAYPPPPAHGMSASDAVLASLTGTAPWARFIAILGFIGTGLLGLLGLLVLFFGLPGEGEAVMRLVGVLYLVIAGVYLVPLVPLMQFATEAGRLKSNPSLAIAAEALRRNRSFWRRIGVLSIIGIGISVLGMVAAILVAVLVAASRS